MPQPSVTLNIRPEQKSIHRGQEGSFFARLVVRCLLCIWGVCVIFPMVWTIYTSFKDNKAFYANAWSLPHVWHFENYSNAWIASSIALSFWNSIVVTSIATVLSLLLAATSAYVFARYPFKGSHILYTLYISAMMVPSVLGLIPLFFLLNTIGLLNSLIGLAIVYAVGSIPFGIFVLTGFFKALPRDLEEAAAIDGCGLFRTFFQIMLPLSKSGLITVGIMNVLTFWNEYFMALVFIQNQTKYTLPIAISYLYQAAQYRTDWGALFAALVISMIPVIIIYALFQRRITSGLTAGAIKG